MKPIIGLATRTTNDGSGNSAGVAYIRSIEKAGGVPILLPLIEDPQDILRMLDLIEGLLLIGGPDVDPHEFGEEPHPKLGTIDVAGDRVELALTRGALDRDLPILAICRGIQLLNVAAGGTLYQDIASQIPDALKHSQRTTEPYVTHRISITEGSLMYSIFGASEIRVNSYHHQSVKDPAPGFRTTAVADDTVVEAIESTRHRFVLGVQCHPERLWEKYPEFLKLFTAFLEHGRHRPV